MIPAVLAVYAIGAPAAYLAGDVYNSQNKAGLEWLPYACAAFPPLGAFMAIVCLTNSGKEGE